MTDAALRGVLEDAQRIGLLGPEPVEHHIAHARTWAAILDPAEFVDLGSGAGVPGLVFAAVWPDARGAVLDGQARRAAWLRTAVARLGWVDRVTVIEGRAEDVGHDPAHRERYGLAVARGFGPPSTTAECASAFVRVGGSVSVSEPPDPDPERWPSAGLERIGLEMSARAVQPTASFVILRKHSPLAADLPRRRNLPLRKPLW
ncbi:MAG: RsmG family class I SAM-dependent methyltransferase [Acidimicrobiia bacterium]